MHQRDAIGLILGNEAAADVADHWHPFYLLQHRHPDGERWVEVGRFPTRRIAKASLDAFVGSGQGVRGDFRKHMKVEEL
jgi:hypothetical protein